MLQIIFFFQKIIGTYFYSNLKNKSNSFFRNISGNPLACDCNLLWLIPWSSNMSVKLQPAPKCETPTAFRGLLVKKLKVGQDLHCDTPLQPLLELKPDQDQVN